MSNYIIIISIIKVGKNKKDCNKGRMLKFSLIWIELNCCFFFFMYIICLYLDYF